MKYRIPLRDLRARGKGEERKRGEAATKKRLRTMRQQREKQRKMGRRLLRREAHKA